VSKTATFHIRDVVVHLKTMEDCKKLYAKRTKALEEAKRNHDYKERIRIYNEETVYNPSDNNDTPEILKKLRTAYRGNTIEYLNDLYFQTMEKIRQADKENNISELLFNSQISLGLIEPLICYNYKHYNSFDIEGIAGVYKGLIYFSVNGIIGQLKNISDLINYFDELDFHKPHIEEAFERAKLSSKIYNTIKTKGDFQQSKLKKELDFDDGRFIASTVGYMIKAGNLEKYKIGKNTFLKIK
jgi:hypothetical protein